MKILAIDTSSKYLSLVIAEDDKILAKTSRPLGRELSRLIMPSIEKGMKRAGLSLNDIDYFGVGLGPGSFTGLRVGLATIKGFAFALGKPIVGVASLDVIAQAVKEKKGLVCSLVDARRSLLYSATYVFKGVRLVRKGRYSLVGIKELLGGIKGYTVFSGDGLAIYRSDIIKFLGENASFTDQRYWYPDPGNLLAIVREKIAGKKLSSPDKVVPLYLYAKECQVRKD